MLPIVTRFIVPKDYGTVDLLTVIVSLTLQIVMLSIDSSVIRFSLEKFSDKSKIVSNAAFIIAANYIIFATIFTLLNLFLSIPYAWFFYLSILLGCVNSILNAFARATDHIKLISVNNILGTLVNITLIFLFLGPFRLGTIGFLLTSVLSGVFFTIVLWSGTKLHKFISLKKLDSGTVRELMRFSLPLVPNGLNWWIMNSSDRIVISIFLGTVWNGIYAVSYKIPTILSMIFGIFYQGWQLSAIEESGKEQFYNNVYKVLEFVLFITGSLVLLVLKPVIRILVAEDYFISYKYVPLLIIGTIFQGLSSFYGVAYLVSKKTKGAFFTSIYGSVTNLLVNILLIKFIGLHAAAVSTFAGYFVMWIVRVIDTRKYFRINLNALRLTICTLLLLIQGFIVIFLNRDHYIVHTVIFTILLVIYKDTLLSTISFSKKFLIHDKASMV